MSDTTQNTELSLKARAEAGCPQCGSPGQYDAPQVDVPEFVMFACGSFIDDRGSFEPATRYIVGVQDPCETIAGLVRELADLHPGSRYADRVSAFTFPPEGDDE